MLISKSLEGSPALSKVWAFTLSGGVATFCHAEHSYHFNIPPYPCSTDADGGAWETAMVNSAKKQVQLSDATADTKAGEAPATFHEQAAEQTVVSNLPDRDSQPLQLLPTQFPREPSHPGLEKEKCSNFEFQIPCAFLERQERAVLMRCWLCWSSHMVPGLFQKVYA